MHIESLHKIIDNLHDGLYFVDRSRTITYWNKAAEKITGYRAEEVLGRSCRDNILIHVDDQGRNLCKGLCPLAATIRDGKNRQAEVFLHHKDGHRVPVLVRISTLKDKLGEIIGGIELFTDISNFSANSFRVRELERLALLDPLTQLANRGFTERELRTRFEEFNRLQVPFGVLFIDIDHFKLVNDTYGHDVGDAVLKYIANCFVANSRPFDFYGRWGGEEFIGIARNTHHDELALISERMRMLVEHSSITTHEGAISVTISIGATLIAEGDSLKSLIKRADSLLYKSKNEGRNRVSLG